jgi:hypothetical protein
VIAPPVPSRGRYELAGGSLATRELRIDNTGEFRQSGGALQAKYVEISGNGDYLFTGGSLNVDAGLHSNGAFDFDDSSATLRSGAAILNFAAGLPHAQNAKIVAGANSLTILPAGFDVAEQLGSLTTQGLVHYAGADLSIPASRTVKGWGRIDDHAIVAGTLAAADATASINVNSLELLAGGHVDLGRGRLTVPDDRTVVRGGSFAATAIDVAGTVVYVPPIVTTSPNGTLNEFQPAIVTPGLARQSAGSVDVDQLQITNGRYEISGGTLQASRIDVGEGRFAFIPSNPHEPSRGFTQRGGTVIVNTLSLSPKYVYPTWTIPFAGAGALELPGLELVDFDGLLPLSDSYPVGPSVYELHGGALQADRISVSQDFFSRTSTFTQTGGAVVASQYFSVHGLDSTYSISGGSLQARRLHVGGTWQTLQRDGTLAILNDDAQITIAGELLLGSGASFIAVPNTTIRLTRPAPPGPYEYPTLPANNVAIHATDSDALSGLSNLTLIFEGGADLVSTIEAAGADRGPSLAGFYQNFALDTLVLGGVEAASLSLVDLVDNSASTALLPEALYVDHLIVNAGSTLDLNGLKLYYRTATFADGESLARASFGIQVVPEPAAVCLALLLAAPICMRRRC